MVFIGILYTIGAFYVISTTLYLMILTVAAYLFRKKVNTSAVPLKIAVLLPAHNEELQINETINVIKKSDYPEDHYSIFVIADNCDDRTAEFAMEAGARVFVRDDPRNRGKGQALDWFFNVHKEDFAGFDAIAIVDADTFIERSFLSEVSASLSSAEVKVVQGFYGVSNPEDSWRTALSSAALNVFHHIRPAGRNRIGGSAGLKGNGMAFRTDILRRYGWPAHSIVEDLEFSIQLLLDDVVVHYNPDAIVYGEMATRKDQAESQRRRWEGGRFQVFRKYALPLLMAYIKSLKIRYLDSFFELFTPPLSILVMGQLTMLLFSAFLYPEGIRLFTFCLLVVVFYVFSGQILRKAPFYVWKNLMAAPFFILWKIPVYLKLVKRGESSGWERTKRKAEIDDDKK